MENSSVNNIIVFCTAQHTLTMRSAVSSLKDMYERMCMTVHIYSYLDILNSLLSLTVNLDRLRVAE